MRVSSRANAASTGPTHSWVARMCSAGNSPQRSGSKSAVACFPVTSADSLSPVAPLAILRTPYVTGTTVLGLKYKDGVMIACDTLGTSRDESRSRPRSDEAFAVLFLDYDSPSQP